MFSSLIHSLDMLNNFCFHVYAQKSLFKVENVNAFFDINAFSLTKLYGQQQHPFLFLSVSRAGSQLKTDSTFLVLLDLYQKV